MLAQVTQLELGISARCGRITGASSKAAMLMSGVLVLWTACNRPVGPSSGPGKPGVSKEVAANDHEVAGKIEHFCGGCHKTPIPADYPRVSWREEVEQGFRLFHDSQRADLKVPTLAEVLRYYEKRAPEELPIPEAHRGLDAGGMEFMISNAPISHMSPGTAHLNWSTVYANDPPKLIESDMRSGQIRLNNLRPDTIQTFPIAKLKNPAHVEVTDLDGDSVLDLVVADLGTFLPADHTEGEIVWLSGSKSQDDDWRRTVLAKGLGRVADVRVADMDGDADLDLVAAEFGWRQTGRVLFLENTGKKDGIPEFKTHVADPRHGAIHVPIRDINRDGKLDFVGLISQEHESIELFHGDGRGGFRPQKIFEGAGPSFGSTGIHLIDLDRDGDDDVLATNGDMFDDFHLRAFHGIRWIENRGDKGWATHELVPMAGVHRALPVDLDGDGDLDIVACALIPSQAMRGHEDLDLASVMWLEQRSPGEFVPHVLERKNYVHAAMEAADFDGDGDVDLALGVFYNEETTPDRPFQVWWNQRIPLPVARP